MKKLAESTDSYFISLLRGALQGEGIEPDILTVSRRGNRNPVFEIWLHDEDDFSKAAELFKEFTENYKLDLEQRKQKSEQPALPSWKCKKCEEELEGQFTSCWNCGQSKDSD
jgi:hypothetical protein